MSYCVYCGKELQENEVCNCEGAVKERSGEKVTEATVTENAVPETTVQEVGKKGILDKVLGLFPNKKVLIGAAAGCCALIVILIVCLSSIFGGKSYKTPFNNLVKELNKGKKADYVKILSATAPDYIAKLYSDYAKLEMVDSEGVSENYHDDWEDLTEKYPKAKIKFVFDGDASHLSKNKLEDFQEAFENKYDVDDILDEFKDQEDDLIDHYEDRYDLSTSDAKKLVGDMHKVVEKIAKLKITDGYKVKGHFEVCNGKDTINKTGKTTFTVLKCNGDWVIWSYDDSYNFDSNKKSYDYVAFLRNYIRSITFTHKVDGLL